MSLAPAADQQFPPAFRLRLKVRNRVIAAADSDGHLFRIFHERRKRKGAGWRPRKRDFMTVRTLGIAVLVSMVIFPASRLVFILVLATVALAVLLWNERTFQQIDGPFPDSVSDIYTADGCHARCARDLYLCGFGAREVLEAIYAEKVEHAALPVRVLGVTVVVMVGLGGVFWGLAIGSPTAMVLWMVGVVILVRQWVAMEGPLRLWLGRRAIARRRRSWLGDSQTFFDLLSSVGVMAAFVLVAVYSFLAAYALGSTFVSAIGLRHWSDELTPLFVFAAVLVILQVVQPGYYAEEELLEAEMARSEVAYRSLLENAILPR